MSPASYFQLLKPITGAPLHDVITSAAPRTLHTKRIWTHRVTREICVPLRDAHATAYWNFSPTTCELASAGIECRGPASGPPRDPLVFLGASTAVAVLGSRDLLAALDTIAANASREVSYDS